MSVKVKFYGLTEKQENALAEISEQLGLDIEDGGIRVDVSEGNSLSCAKNSDGVKITYTAGREHELYRALSLLPRVIKGEAAIDEKSQNSMLCYMADVSRNAVCNIQTAKRVIRYLALMGFDSLMLYSEDTFEIPEYPYFGYMRGRYSKEELIEIDDYADMFGIEVIPCVQTLAHLTTAIRWPGLASFADTENILLVGDERTYTFIDAIMKTCAECFRSRRINIGMDEAHALGLGRYLKKNGYTPAPEIMLAHLDRVVKICTDNGFHPMIWSDMFFRMAFGGTYRVASGEISQDIIDRVPENLTLIYWDYYSLDKPVFTHMVECHQKFHNPISFAGGAWKWSGFAPHNRFSLVSTELQLDVCEEKGIDSMIVTAWGDNGAEASQFAPLPTLLYFAERVFGAKSDNESMEKRSHECFGIGYEDLLTLDAPNELKGIDISAGHPLNPCKYLLFNDPLEGLFDCHLDVENAPIDFHKNASKLEALASHPEFGYMFDSLAKLCYLLEDKCDLGVRTRRAYKADDRSELSEIANDVIPLIITELDDFRESFKKQWYAENKTFGFAVQEIRLGGLKERLISTADRLNDYIDGNVEKIEELEADILPYDGRRADDTCTPYISQNQWHKMVTGCVI